LHYWIATANDDIDLCFGELLGVFANLVQTQRVPLLVRYEILALNKAFFAQPAKKRDMDW
jgi:hypothetical protein